MSTIDRANLASLSRSALTAAGASDEVADVLTRSALFAQDRGFVGVGVSHLFDHLDAMADGRLDGAAVPVITRAAPAMLRVDAMGGVFHTGFEAAYDDLSGAARDLGVATLVQRGAYASGQLGWFTDRLAADGLLALATVTSPPLLSTGPGIGRVFGTNPMAWSAPRGDDGPITVDQASSATAYVSVRQAAAQGRELPDGWALGPDLQPTRDASAALEGALLPFGGYKGGNLAWFVEVFSSMAGGAWSLDAPSPYEGDRCPAVGMFLLALDPAAVDPDYPNRIHEHVERLAGLGVRRPGMPVPAGEPATLEVDDDVLAELRRRAEV